MHFQLYQLRARLRLNLSAFRVFAPSREIQQRSGFRQRREGREEDNH
jgi:hypothetical protein